MPISLSEAEYELLAKLASMGVKPGEWLTTEELAKLLGWDRSRLEPIARLLASKGVLKLREVEREEWRLTEEGQRRLREGLPEERLVEELKRRGGEAPLSELSSALGGDLQVAIANAARKGIVRVEGGVARLVRGVEPREAGEPERSCLEALASGGECSGDVLKLLRRRRLVERRVERVTEVTPARPLEEVLREASVEVGALTSELIRSGAWRRLKLRAYNVAAAPPRRLPGRLNAFRVVIEEVRDVLLELGFVEVTGGPVETEFWNYDALFQPQWHPARSPTDTFYLAHPREGRLPDPLWRRVARAHEEGVAGSVGWGYEWDPRRAARLILRSHTTAVSARTLASKPRPPFRYFTIGRVYRVEKVDPKHLPEFHQVDGIMGDYDMSFSELLGTLAEFLERIGVKEYRFKPSYFPFTEPSAEGYARVKGVWMEVLGCGMFRPEVTVPLGVEYPVAAWGMGLERLAMAILGLTDIRQLYSRRVEELEEQPVGWWLRASH